MNKIYYINYILYYIHVCNIVQIYFALIYFAMKSHRESNIKHPSGNHTGGRKCLNFTLFMML